MLLDKDFKELSNNEIQKLGKWYTLQVYFNNELAAKRSIELMLEQKGWSDKIKYILIPTEEVIYITKGKEDVKEKALYQGYAFICSNGTLDKSVWMEIQALPKVSGFIKHKNDPVELYTKDLDSVISKYRVKRKPRLRNDFVEDELIRIEEGSFANFTGRVQSFKPDTGILTVEVVILGRATPVEIDYKLVSKVI